MRFSLLFFCFFVGSANATEDLFNKALINLQDNKPEEASRLFSEFLKTEPASEAGLFNLALSLYRQSGKKDPARAYWRQILFNNPYSRQTKEALNSIEDKKYFWVWIPQDLVLGLIALSWFILILIFFKKNFFAFRWWIPIWFIFHGFSFYYFYYRMGNYSTLMQDSMVLSAPDTTAPVLFEQKAGAMVKVLPKKDNLQEWSHIEISPGKRGWLHAHLLLPLKTNTKSSDN